MVEGGKQISKNLIVTAIFFLVNTAINVCLSSYVINNIGIEANGFITLANTFVDYASLITIALNTVAGRFIALEIGKNDYNRARKYFSSTLLADFVIGAVLLIIGAMVVFFLEVLIEVPTHMLLDVKILFALVFINFFLSVMISVFSVSTFICNRMDLASLRKTEAVVLKGSILVLAFGIFVPHMYYVSIASLAYSLYYLIFNLYYTKRYTPELKFRINDFSWKMFFEMISGGIWNTITQIGFILTSGLDLLICNKWLGPVAMGQMSFPKQLYNIITGFISTLVTSFHPTFVKLYAQGDKDELIRKIKEAMGLCGMLASIVLADVVIYGEAFLKLYIPGQDTKLIWILMVLSLQVLFVSGTMYPLYYIYTLTNRLKLNSYIEIIAGILNVLIVFCFIRFTDIGIYAVAGVSTGIGLLKNLFFTPMYSASCLKVPLRTFYPQIGKYVVAVIANIIVNGVISQFVIVDSWLALFLVGAISVLVGAVIGVYVICAKDYRKKVLLRLGRIIKK